jgi:hypothetical protein
MTQTIFQLSCKRSLDNGARRAYVHGVDKRKETHMTILSDLIDALAAAAIVAGVICLAIALNP